jgi:hypothetical protein
MFRGCKSEIVLLPFLTHRKIILLSKATEPSGANYRVSILFTLFLAAQITSFLGGANYQIWLGGVAAQITKRHGVW